jgi:hypothetical protein
LFVFAVCLAVFFFHAVITKHAIYGDGNAYYAYSHALYFEKKLNFDPIYTHLENFHGVKGIFSRVFWDTTRGPFGIRSNIFMIGTGIAWLPSMLFINIVSFVFGLGLTKFDLIYELGPGISGILFMLSGFYFLEKYLTNFFSKKVSFLTVLIIFITSNAFYFSSFEPAQSHQPVFFIISFLLYKTYHVKAKFWDCITIGFLSGFVFMTRMSDIVLLIPIFYQLLKDLKNRKNLLIIGSAAFVGLSPLLWSQFLMYGNFLQNPYITGSNGGYFIFNLKHMSEFFISAKRGLFLWHPIYLVALIGLFKYLRRYYVILITILIIFGVSSAWSANTSAGFGQRYILAGIPYFAMGLARIVKKLNLKSIIIFSSVLVIWNVLTLFQFYANPADMIGSKNISPLQFISGQFSTPVKTYILIKNHGFNQFFSQIF